MTTEAQKGKYAMNSTRLAPLRPEVNLAVIPSGLYCLNRKLAAGLSFLDFADMIA